jgi:hypothetical protein
MDEASDAGGDDRQESGPPRSVRDVAGPPRPARPTPVREALERDQPPPTPERPPPTRTFDDAREQRWQVRLMGRARTGTGSDPGAPLLLLRFRRRADEAEEGVEDPGAPGAVEELEFLAVAGELDALTDVELRDLLERATPPAFEPGDFFTGTRRGRRGERQD